MSNLERLCMSGMIREMMYVELKMQAAMHGFGADAHLFK